MVGKNEKKNSVMLENSMKFKFQRPQLLIYWNAVSHSFTHGLFLYCKGRVEWAENIYTVWSFVGNACRLPNYSKTALACSPHTCHTGLFKVSLWLLRNERLKIISWWEYKGNCRKVESQRPRWLILYLAVIHYLISPWIIQGLLYLWYFYTVGLLWLLSF